MADRRSGDRRRPVAGGDPARADGFDVGVRGGYYSDAEASFAGVDLLTPIARSWYFNPNFEYAFVDNGSAYTLNGDVHYDLPVSGAHYVWLGGGPALIVPRLRPRLRRPQHRRRRRPAGRSGLEGLVGGALRPGQGDPRRQHRGGPRLRRPLLISARPRGQGGIPVPGPFFHPPQRIRPRPPKVTGSSTRAPSRITTAVASWPGLAVRST